MAKTMLASTVAHKKDLLHKLISNSVLDPWQKLRPIYIEIILGQEDDTGKEIFFVRVNKLPPHEMLPTSYFNLPIIYLELPLAN